MDLFGGYIGDSYPLCSDLPKRQFLNIGAKYILLGSSAIPEYQNGEEWWEEGWWRAYNNITNLTLNTTSSALYSALCNAGSDGKCRFQSVVVLNQTLTCERKECLIDEPRTIRVSTNPLVERMLDLVMAASIPGHGLAAITQTRVVLCGLLRIKTGIGRIKTVLYKQKVRLSAFLIVSSSTNAIERHCYYLNL